MENCWEEAPHSSQDYYPHYNLFQSSIFYDTDNFRVSYLSYKYDDSLPSESSETEERSAEPPDKRPAPPVTRERRVITKDELYRDPDLFRSKYEDGQTNSNGAIEPPTQHWGYDWTKQSWVKEGAPLVVVPEEQGRMLRGTYQPLDAPQVKSSKAESMMQKMGWQGGALGKTGEGIVQPLAPDPAYAFRSLGFGQRTKSPKKPPAKASSKKQPKKDSFRTNVLMHILDFVQDDTETELVFDRALRQYERRHIVNIVNTIVNEQQVHSLGSASQYDLAADIHRHNQYVLEMVTTGDVNNRQLGIYKEAPEDVYLVTPDDFAPKDDADDNSDPEPDEKQKPNDEKQKPNDEKTPENGMEMDEDENPFLKSIKKSIKKDEVPKSISNKFETGCTIAKDSESKGVVRKVETPVSAADKMLEFFLEFVETESYKELRFLGKFSEEQSAAINALLNDVALRAAAGAAPRLRLRAAVNGTAEIHKVPADPRAK